MARGKHSKDNKQVSHTSLRESIKTHRRGLHGDAAQAFDEAFCETAGDFPLKKALTNGSNLQKAFVAAKAAADLMKKTHPIVQVPNLPEENEE